MGLRVARAQAPHWGPVAKTPTPAENPTPPEEQILETLHLSEVEPVDTSFLWYPYIPAGKLTVLEGDPGMGKSWITCAISCAVSAGVCLPGQRDPLPPQKVLLASAEDGIADVIVPRLRSLGAQMDNIFAIRDRFLLDHNGVRLLRNSMRAFAATIVFIDPIVAYLGAKMDMHRANEVREVTSALAEAAEETGCSVVMVRHLRKGTGGKDIYKGIGSIDFTASARSALLVKDWDGQRLLTHIKANNAPLGKPILYQFSNEDPQIWVEGGRYHAKASAGSFEWGKQLDLDPTGDGAGPAKPKPQVVPTAHYREQARTFLRTVLRVGPLPATEVMNLAKEEHIALHTLTRAKDGLVRSRKDGAGAWMWELIAPEEASANV